MKEKKLTIIKKHWESPNTVSLKDNNLSLLERSVIIKQLKKLKINRLADLGCGNCDDTLYFSEYANIIDAYDYSEKMIQEGLININESKIKNISLKKLDLINDQINSKYNTIITKRALINLGNYDNQKSTIIKIYNSIKKGGDYLMLECSKDGLENLNKIRKSFGLEDLTVPFHNYYFVMNQLMDYLEDYFEVVDKIYFSDYYYLTRVVGPTISPKNPFKYDNIFKTIASLDLIKNQIGPQFFFHLRKI